MEDGTCNVVCFNSLKHIESHRASGGLIRSSGVSLFIDLCLLDFVNFFLSVFLKQVLRFLCGEEVLFSQREGLGLINPGPFCA